MTTPGMSTWLDQFAIRCVIERYTDAINRQDWVALAPLFAQSAVWETSGGPVALRFEGRETVLGALQGMISSLDFLLQSLSTIVIDVRGDRASARVSLSELGRDKQGQGMANHGFYFDDLARVDGEWRFLRRAFRFRYTEQAAVNGQVFMPTPPPAL
jgi:ketosteroid isomerase-like protein